MTVREPMERKRVTVREKVLAAAADLFTREGIRAVGVDAIVKRAGVPKISLYRNFSSKDDLLMAYLEERGTAYWRHLDDLIAKHPGDGRAQIDAIMTYLAERTTQPDYPGCPFIRCAIEFPDSLAPVHGRAKTVKRELRRRLTNIMETLGAPKPLQLADALMLLVEGAYAVSQTLGGPNGPGKEIVWAANALIDAQLGSERPKSTFI